MNTLKIQILNPKAGNLLKDLADLNLISIENVAENGFTQVLNRLRTKAKTPPSLDDITAEVESVRSKRYGK